MRGDLDKLRIADRTETILRKDRQALRVLPLAPLVPQWLLVLVPDDGAIVDLMDAYLPDLAEAAGLQFVRQVVRSARELPEQQLRRAGFVVADLTGRNEHVVTLVYRALGMNQRVLLTAQSARDIPTELSHVPAVTYGLAAGQFEELLESIQQGYAQKRPGVLK